MSMFLGNLQVSIESSGEVDSRSLHFAVVELRMPVEDCIPSWLALLVFQFSKHEGLRTDSSSEVAGNA